MIKKLTATIDEDVYIAYKKMASNKTRESEALEWVEATFGDLTEPLLSNGKTVLTDNP